MAEILDIPKNAGKWLINKTGDNPVSRRLFRAAGPFLRDSFTEMMHFCLDEFDKLPELVASTSSPDKPYPLLFIASTHQSHADSAGMVEVIRRTRLLLPQLGAVYAPVATTLANGKQGGVTHAMHTEIAEPSFDLCGITPMYIVTPNDVTRRGETLSLSKAREQKRMISDAAAEAKSAFLVLMEGTVQSGRHDKHGRLFGMQEVTTPLLRYVTSRAREIGREIIIAPLGMSRTYRLLSAEKIWFTRNSFHGMWNRIVGGGRVTLAEATAGTPFILGHDVSPVEVTDLVMRQHVAPLIPEEERGFYR